MNDSTESQRFQQELEERRLEGLRTALGPQILGALEDPDVVEIMLNCDKKLWIEKFGSMEHVGFIERADSEAILRQVSSSLDGVLSKTEPIIEGELLLDGSRFEGLVPPVVENPIFAIRKKASRIYPLDEYVRKGVLSFYVAEMLRKAIVDQQNILVVGGTGTGKTTFCNALLNEIGILCPTVRMLVLEDTKELQCNLENRVFLRTSEWTSLTRLSKAVNRLRPDRITVGEVREGQPALDLLKLWNTGHPGGMATVHANSAYSGLTRLEQLVGEASKSPQFTLIGEAINYAVYLERSSTKGRQVKEIIKVNGYSKKEGRYLFENIPLQL